MRRLTILLAAAAALLLVPAAQAFANGTMKVNIEGSGGGEVGPHPSLPELAGSPPLHCVYSPPGPATGICENELAESEGTELEAMRETPAEGSRFVGWVVEKGSFFACEEEENCFVYVGEGEPSELEVTAIFECETEGGCEGPAGPTNRRLLTVTKSPSPSAGTGVGTVKSKPKGINCASACDEAVASLYKETTVLISAKAATGSTLEGWEGCESTTVISATEGTCTVAMTEDQAVKAEFAGASKAIPNPQALSLAKEGTGFGTVKSKPGGIACEADCTASSALYAGELTEPKPKAATKVILTVTPVPGSSFDGWSGACSGEALTCEVEMTEAKEAIAEFTALPKNTLSVTKSPSPSAGTGVGTVKSKPKGINCATACAEQTASLAEDTTVVLAAKAATGSTLAGWEGCESTTVISATEGTCTVAMATAQEVTAEFAGTSKAIANPQALTLAKAGSGFGTVKSKPGGIACEVLCTATTALYQGTLTEPKPKAAATVILTATSAPGSKAVVWSGCDEVNIEGQCVVAMSEAKEVTATFDELE